MWGAQVHGLDLGINDTPFDVAGVFISQVRSVRGRGRRRDGGAACSCSSATPAPGLAFRAVADDQFAALAVGLRLPRIWASGVDGGGHCGAGRRVCCGARDSGVQFSFSLVVLKALPVLVLGGFNSIAGAIVGGLLIGATEKLAEVYIGPFFGGGIETWFAYVVALGFLLVRPSGLFGQKLVERA